MHSNFSVLCDTTESGDILGYFLSRDGEVIGYYNDRQQAIADALALQALEA